MLGLESQLVFQKDDRAELGGVIFYVEAVLLTLDDSMAPADTDVVDTHLTLVASSQLELRLFWRDRKQMNVSGGVLIQRHRFQQDIVVIIIHVV